MNLSNLRLATPCKERWADMIGDDRVRACAGCNRLVFNLSEMTRDEAESVLATRGLTPCVRFYRRADGTVMTTDCPTGAPRPTRRLAIVATTALAGSTPALAEPAPPPPPVPDAVTDPAPAEPITIELDHEMGIPVPTDDLIDRGALAQPAATALVVVPIDDQPLDRSTLEWSVWARLGYGVASHPAGVAARSTAPPMGDTSAAWEMAINSDLTVPAGPIRLGGWVELRNTSAPVLGGELVLGDGGIALRAGGNTDVGTAAIGLGYTTDRVGIRVVASVNQALGDAHDWSATLGFELGLRR